MKRWIYIIAITVAALGLVGLTIIMREFESAMAVRVNIPKNATQESVRDSLAKSLGTDYGSVVYRLWQVASGDPAKAHGSYVVEPGTTAVTAAHNISENRQTPVKVTINNVRTLDDLTKRLGAKLEVTPSEIKEAMHNIIGGSPHFGGVETYPAAFLPDTYEFYWTDPAEHVVQKLVAERNKFWNRERLDKAAKLGLTPVEVATIASIVEEESNKKDERPTIARLYMNRVNQGMKLQADPTVKFATGNFALRRITGKHLKIDSPYNTYRNAGLPPGPIRIPQKETIDAVLNAPPNSYIYMCAKEDFSGYHNFASDYKTHAANAKKYQAALNRRGIR